MQEQAATAPDPSSALYLIQALKANDEQVMQSIYQKNYPKVEYYVLKNSGTQAAAKDIYQEAFIAMWKNIKQNRFEAKEADAINGYLFRIAKNKWLDYLKSAHNRKMVSVEEHHHDAAEELEDEEQNTRLKSIQDAFGQLGNECKTLLNYFYYAKKSMKEIADLLSLDPASARNKKYRCMQRLRTITLGENSKS